MTLDELKKAVADGTVDTVLLAIADMEGRLQGKRLTASHFLDDVARARGRGLQLPARRRRRHGDGRRLRDGLLGARLRRLRDEVPDLDTLRPVPWHEGTVMLLADLQWDDGREVVASPRQILRRQLARLAERGWVANAGTELEFIVFRDTYEEAWKKALPRPRAGQPLQHRLLAARHGAGRAADPPDPQRDGRPPA